MVWIELIGEMLMRTLRPMIVIGFAGYQAENE
jgi:hypothetical protein